MGSTASRPSSIQPDRRHRDAKSQNQHLETGAVQPIKRHIFRAIACKQPLTKAARCQHAAENSNGFHHCTRMFQQKWITLIHHHQKEPKPPDVTGSIGKAVSQIRQTVPISPERHQFTQFNHQQKPDNSKQRPGRPDPMLPV